MRTTQFLQAYLMSDSETGIMEFKHVTKYKEGYMPVIEADEGRCLLGGHTISDGAVYDNYSDALYVMHAIVKDNIAAHRAVKSGKAVPFKGMVDCLERVKPDPCTDWPNSIH